MEELEKDIKTQQKTIEWLRDKNSELEKKIQEKDEKFKSELNEA